MKGRLLISYILLQLIVQFVVCPGLTAQTQDNRYSMVFHTQENHYAWPMSAIDSVVFPQDFPSAILFSGQNHSAEYNVVDSICFCTLIDTVFVTFKDSVIQIENNRADAVQISLDSTDVHIALSNALNVVLLFKGQCENGRIKLEADTLCSVVFAGLRLKSFHGPAFNSITNAKIKIEIADSTANHLEDAAEYELNDSTEDANGCLNSQGHIDFWGNGTLSVIGNRKHAIYCKKGIRFKQGTIRVENAVSDAIHSGKYVSIEGAHLELSGMSQDGIDADEYFTLNSGSLEMCIKGNGCKGIKCKEDLSINGGVIDALALGDIRNQDGDLMYPVILKSSNNVNISGGTLRLVHNGMGGKCISADKNFNISDGEICLETTGDGAEYINLFGEHDFFTSKCVSAKDSILITNGTINCLSTGLGGKGIVCDNYMEIGAPILNDSGPQINIETMSTCIIDDVDEDQRFGCPKGIKVGNVLNVYAGVVYIVTHGQGGEGIECKKEMYVYGGSIECHCYDDGINTGGKLDVFDGAIFCNSIMNDGIDSNGKITLLGGVVAAINQNRPNESFDSENERLYLYGSTVFGIGCSPVHIAECTTPYYNSFFTLLEDGSIDEGITLSSGKYVYIIQGNEVVFCLFIDSEITNVYFTFASNLFKPNQEYLIFQGDKPFEWHDTFFDGKFFIGGKCSDNTTYITSFNTF